MHEQYQHPEYTYRSHEEAVKLLNVIPMEDGTVTLCLCWYAPSMPAKGITTVLQKEEARMLARTLLSIVGNKDE